MSKQIITADEICDEMRKALPEKDIDHWQSDLYVRMTLASREIIDRYEFKNLVSAFIDQIDHVQWYEIPFAWTTPKGEVR